MNQSARRPVPHIEHTPELEAAACAVTLATGPNGKPVMLCANPFDVVHVRGCVSTIGAWFIDPDFFLEGDNDMTELKAAENLILLATLLREHLKAGNT